MIEQQNHPHTRRYAIWGICMGLLVLNALSPIIASKQHFDNKSYSTFGGGNKDFQIGPFHGYALIGSEIKSKKPEENLWQIVVVLNRDSLSVRNDDLRNSIVILDKNYQIIKEQPISYEEYMLIKKSPNEHIEDFIRNQLLPHIKYRPDRHISVPPPCEHNVHSSELSSFSS